MAAYPKKKKKKQKKKKKEEAEEEEQNTYIHNEKNNKITNSVDPHELLPGVSHLANPGICNTTTTTTTLVQIMACRLFGAKPLPEPMLTYCLLDP